MPRSSNYLGKSKSHVTYVATLGQKSIVEEVQLFQCRCPGGVAAVLYRYGRPICWFIPSEGQAEKISENKRGEKIHITEGMIEKARIYGFGRDGGGGGAHVRGHKKMFRIQSLATAEDVLGGAVSEDNVYVSAYGSVLPGYKHPSKLGVGEATRKKYALSGQKPTTYVIVRES